MARVRVPQSLRPSTSDEAQFFVTLEAAGPLGQLPELVLLEK